MSEEMKLAFILFCSICGLVGMVISMVCVAMVAGFTRSTHTVQYVPHENDAAFVPPADILAANEQALLDKVGKKKKEEPTVIESLDSAIDEINNSELKF